MSLTLIAVSTWMLLSVPLGMLIGAAMHVAEANGASNAPRALHTTTTDDVTRDADERALDIAA